MNYATIAASIRGPIADSHYGVCDIEAAVKSVMLILMVESWDHTANELVRLNDLTDSEYRTLDMWAKDTKSGYSSKIAHIKDMRQVFPGIGLATAKHFCD
jgi:ribosomal protein L7/L12